MGSRLPGIRRQSIQGLAIGGFASGAGIRVDSSNDQILGDYVGVLPGATPTPAPDALGIYASGNNNTIGGTAAGSANVVADNSGAGITIDTGTGNLISGSQIYNNSAGNRAPEWREQHWAPPAAHVDLRVHHRHADLDFGMP